MSEFQRGYDEGRKRGREEGSREAKRYFRESNSYARLMNGLQNLKWDLEEGNDAAAERRLREMFKWLS